MHTDAWACYLHTVSSLYKLGFLVLWPMSSVTLGKWLQFSMPQFPQVKVKAPAQRLCKVLAALNCQDPVLLLIKCVCAHMHMCAHACVACVCVCYAQVHI